MTETTSSPSGVHGPDDALYDAAYYAHHCAADGDLTYERNAHWLRFFGQAAERIVADIAPRTVLDAGCAHGFLVEALRDRGVDARGFDISEFAISKVREDVRPYCRVASVLEPLGERCDLITCIEVLEHLEQGDAVTAVANICAAADDVIFTSTPTDHREETHVNVRPPEYWVGLFAAQGFVRDLSFDGSYLAWWAMRFRRARDPWQRSAVEYERELWRLSIEARERNTKVVDQMKEINDLQAQIASIQATQAQVSQLERSLSDSQALILEMEARLRRRVEEVVEVEALRGAPTYRLASGLLRIGNRAAPRGTRRGRAARLAARGAVVLLESGPVEVTRRVRRRWRDRSRPPAVTGPTLDEQYQVWLQQHEPVEAELAAMRVEAKGWLDRPLISILLPVYNPEESWLRDAIESVRAQAYDHWELCVADDASTRPHVARLLSSYAAEDTRIRVCRRPRNEGIARASNTALDLATGDFVGLLDHDDVLRPHALFRTVEHLRKEPETDIVYSDEDKILVNGTRGAAFFKPDWSPDWLLAQNYVCHFAVLRRSLVVDLGGFRLGYDGSQDHDLLLRATEVARRIGHIRDVLYSWRQVPGSAALSSDAKPAAREAGRRAVLDAMRRRGYDGRVEHSSVPGCYDARYQLVDRPRVSVVIPTRDRLDLLRECIQSIETRSTYSNFEIVIVNNDSRSPDTLEYFRDTPHRVVQSPGAFNFSRIVNVGVRSTTAPFVVLLNNDAMAQTPDWLERMLEHAQRDEIAAVGCQLRFPDGRFQHCGVGLGYGHLAFNIHVEWPGARNTSAVTAACMMLRRQVYDELDGFDEAISVAFNDVDFCLRARQRGYRVLYTPHVQFVHDESSSRGRQNPTADIALFRSRWGDEHAIRDPYLSPHLHWPYGDSIHLQ